ncbi:MAG: hypothetical protein RLZZ417_2394, partial [Bacteroidota bacterium]
NIQAFLKNIILLLNKNQLNHTNYLNLNLD